MAPDTGNKPKSSQNIHNPRAVVIVCDATFYGKKKDKLGTLVFKDFLAEKTINPNTLKESFTHQKLVSAYRSLRTNLPYLFTCKNEKNVKIHNITNAIDGGVFSPMKK